MNNELINRKEYADRMNTFVDDVVMRRKLGVNEIGFIDTKAHAS